MPKFKLTKVPNDEIPTLKTAAAYNNVLFNDESAHNVADEWYLEASCRNAADAYEMGKLHMKLLTLEKQNNNV